MAETITAPWREDIATFFSIWGDPRTWTVVGKGETYGLRLSENSTEPEIVCKDFPTLAVVVGALIEAYDKQIQA